MTFKEECLQFYEKVGKRNEMERKKRVADTVKRHRNQIIKDFERNFKRPFKEEYLIEEQEEYGYILNTIIIDEIRVRVSFRADGSGYYGDYFLLIPCHKCGKETNYKNSLMNPFLHNIGRILNEDPTTSPYARICGECDGKRRDLEKKQRDERYIKNSKERNSDLYSKLADALVEVLRRGGYRDMINDDEDVET